MSNKFPLLQFNHKNLLFAGVDVVVGVGVVVAALVVCKI